jgi:hypothetical protein
MKKILVCAFALAIGLMLVSPAIAVAEPKKGKPSFAEEKGQGGNGGQSDKWVLNNSEISVWFQGKKPMLKVFSTGDDGNTSGYMLKMEKLYETSADGAEAAHINLNAASLGWTASTANETDGITLTLEGNVSGPGNSDKTTTATVKFVFHINSSSGEVKFDLAVENWVWKSADPANATLSLKMLTVSDVATQSADNETSIGGKGYMRWEKNAQAARSNGTEGALEVQAEVGGEGNGSSITLTFNGTGGYQTLSYDPVLGISGTNWNLVIGTIVLAVAGVAAILIYTLSKKKY